MSRDGIIDQVKDENSVPMRRENKTKRKSCWDRDPSKVAEAEAVLRGTRSLSRDPARIFATLAEGQSVKLPRRTDLGVIAGLFESLNRGDFASSPLQPDAAILRRILDFCREETDLLGHPDASGFAKALLALSAHHSDWVRPLDAWRARTHNAHRQFHSLVRHLIAAYEVPTFLDAAWMEGLTPEAVRHQGWYKLVGRGENIRTAGDLPVPLTRRQAHHFLLAPDDLDIPSAFRWALVMDLGGDERLARSILATRIGTEFGDEAFCASVVRFFIAHPGLDPDRHGPIIDYLQSQRSVPSVPNPLADLPGQPTLVPPQPSLTMKGRTPESLRRAIIGWHRELAERRSATTAVGSWAPSGFLHLSHEEGMDDERRIHEVTELLTAQDLFEEGKAMTHCVASYAHACASGRSSIWSLRTRIESGRVIRQATVEVRSRDGVIIQVRRRANKPPTGRDLAILRRWGEEGGPGLASWFGI